MAAPRSFSRLTVIGPVLAVALLASACAEGFEDDRGGLITALEDIAELSNEEATCVADRVDELEYRNDEGDPISTGDLLSDVADGESDVYEQFLTDLEAAVESCGGELG